ncbi:OmpP1/FadL family transporter [Elizabethkingia sp. JS20170427COW]|uniref:OmpP1/FadL family transporter n=1 Tax=Elizabethkingia sp. JS20170427COW TaxID=2583851 RepID=UPI001110B8F6|nr:outer membrane protein transport protein [Elizabethkingia sp. JS20170427COW]QCX53106.1 aromatic hydrocarbon degradation protein [Elizabethkingia sp. JS20170427COW]
MKKFFLPIALAASVASYAGGFRLSLQGVKQLAMAHTSAHTEDASVAFFNPAGISFVPSKLSVAAGGFGVNTKMTFQDTNTLQSFKTDNPVGTPIYAAVTYKVLDNLSVGFSFTTPYGSHLIWDDNWSGKDVVQELDLKSFFFTPMISYKLAPWMSVGVSYTHATGKLNWDRAVTLINGEMNLKDEKAKGNGFGLGFYFRPDEKLDVSVAYRSAITMKAKNGRAQFSGVSSSLYPLLGLDANGGDRFRAQLPLVDEYTLGLTYKITPRWSVSGDFNYYGWEKYSKLTIDFANATVGNQASDPTQYVNPKEFKNSKSFRIGTQYWFNDKIAGRLGYYFDESPYADDKFSPETPSMDANVLTGGLGLKFGKLGVDLAASYNFYRSRIVSNNFYPINGQIKGSAFIFGLGLSYNAF